MHRRFRVFFGELEPCALSCVRRVYRFLWNPPYNFFLLSFLLWKLDVVQCCIIVAHGGVVGFFLCHFCFFVFQFICSLCNRTFFKRCIAVLLPAFDSSGVFIFGGNFGLSESDDTPLQQRASTSLLPDATAQTTTFF